MTQTNLKVGDRVIANVTASTSFYKRVIGNIKEVEESKNRVWIIADTVQSKWSNEFKAHPSNGCSMSLKIENCEKI